MNNLPFHLALPCKSISETRKFYVDVLGAGLGRHASQWLDIDLFGNQMTFTKSGEYNFSSKSYKFEDTVLPSFHFGVIVDRPRWVEIYSRLNGSDFELTKEVTFLKDKNGEHRSFFVEDPNGYMVEFKSFTRENHIFRKND